MRNDSRRSIGIAAGSWGRFLVLLLRGSSAITRSIFRKGANFTAAMAFEMASTNLVLELSIINGGISFARVAFILAT